MRVLASYKSKKALVLESEHLSLDLALALPSH